MQTLHIEGTLYASGNITWYAEDGLPLNIYAKTNVVAFEADRDPTNLKPGDVYIKGDLRVQGLISLDENIGTPQAHMPA